MRVADLLEAKNEILPDEVLAQLICLFVRDYIGALKAHPKSIRFEYEDKKLGFLLSFVANSVYPLSFAHLMQIERVYDMVDDWTVLRHSSPSHPENPMYIEMQYSHSIECDVKKFGVSLQKAVGSSIPVSQW